MAAHTARIPEVGEKVALFGLFWTVTVVEPASDWYWNIEATVEPDGAVAKFTIPTDERTV